MLLNKKDVRIIFMGTPEFAVASLEALLHAEFHIVAVVTAPDKPAGRGMAIHESAVKKIAVSKHIPVLQPVNLKDPVFLDQLASYKAELQVVVAFRMLPEKVWNMPAWGTINLHGSLLPQYRGAAPINWAIINGEIETGVTTFKLQHAIDTGNILLQDKIPITEETTAGDLHDTMKMIGASLLVKTIEDLLKGTLSEIPQVIRPGEIYKAAPKIHPADCKLNFQDTVENIHNRVRGLSPVPGAYTDLHGHKFKIYKTIKEIRTPDHLPGVPVSDGKTYLKFSCRNGYLICTEVQLEGKKRMDIESFLRGYRLP
jgi:methionyl-tRNA formyltransferase